MGHGKATLPAVTRFRQQMRDVRPQSISITVRGKTAVLLDRQTEEHSLKVDHINHNRWPEISMIKIQTEVIQMVRIH